MPHDTSIASSESEGWRAGVSVPKTDHYELTISRQTIDKLGNRRTLHATKPRSRRGFAKRARQDLNPQPSDP